MFTLFTFYTFKYNLLYIFLNIYVLYFVLCMRSNLC